MKRSCIVALVLLVTLSACDGDDTDVVVATLPAKAQLYPEVPHQRRPDAVPSKRFDARRLIGHDLGWAERLAARFDCTLRITDGDGAAKAFTADYAPRRIDIAVHHDVVTGLE